MKINFPVSVPFKFGESTSNISKFWLPLPENVEYNRLTSLLHHLHIDGAVYPVQIDSLGTDKIVEASILPYRISDSDFYSGILFTVGRVLSLPLIVAQTVDGSFYLVYTSEDGKHKPGFVEKVNPENAEHQILLDAIENISVNPPAPISKFEAFRAQSMYRGMEHDRQLSKIKSGIEGISEYLDVPMPDNLKEVSFSSGIEENFRSIFISGKATLVEALKLLPNGFVVNAFQANEYFVINAQRTSQIKDLLELAGFWTLPLIVTKPGHGTVIYLVAVNLYFTKPVEGFLEPVEKAYHPEILTLDKFINSILNYKFSTASCSESLKRITELLSENPEDRVYTLEPGLPGGGSKGTAKRKRFYDLAAMDIKDYSGLYGHFFRLSRPDGDITQLSQSFQIFYEYFIFIIKCDGELDKKVEANLSKCLGTIDCESWFYLLPTGDTAYQIYLISSYTPVTLEALNTLYSAAFHFRENAILSYCNPDRATFELFPDNPLSAQFIPIEPSYSLNQLQDLLELNTGFKLDFSEFMEFTPVSELKGMEKVNFSASLVKAINDFGLNAFSHLLGEKTDFKPFI